MSSSAASAKKKKGPLAGKRVRGKAKNRDPDKPRRPRSAYNYYAADNYQAVRQELLAVDPQSKATAVISRIAVDWKGLSAKAKKPFQQKAAAAKKVHDKAMDIYKEKEKSRKKEIAKSAKSDKTKPKRAMSAYLFFGKDKRMAIKSKLGPNAKVTDVMKEIARQWAALSNSSKAKYKKQAAEAREAYVKDMDKWKGIQKAVLHSSWKFKWKAARKAEVDSYYAETAKMTGAQLLNLKGDAAKDIKRKTKAKKKSNVVGHSV
jgi:hypothetical protein